MTFRRQVFLTIVLIASGAAIFQQCFSGAQQDLPEITAHDRVVIERSKRLIEEQLHSLSDDHDIVLIYGRFLSLNVQKPVKRRANSGSFGPGLGYPTHITFECICEFSKFRGMMTVSIMQGWETTEVEFDVTPSHAAATLGPLSGCKVIQQGNELWYVREGGDNLKSRSVLSCRILDPDFEPQSK